MYPVGIYNNHVEREKYIEQTISEHGLEAHKNLGDLTSFRKCWLYSENWGTRVCYSKLHLLQPQKCRWTSLMDKVKARDFYFYRYFKNKIGTNVFDKNKVIYLTTHVHTFVHSLRRLCLFKQRSTNIWGPTIPISVEKCKLVNTSICGEMFGSYPQTRNRCTL